MVYICYARVVKPIVVRILIDNGIQINHLDSEKQSVLVHASSKQTALSIWEILVDAGADVKIIDKYNKNIIDKVLFRYSPALPEKIIKTLI